MRERNPAQIKASIEGLRVRLASAESVLLQVRGKLERARKAEAKLLAERDRLLRADVLDLEVGEIAAQKDRLAELRTLTREAHAEFVGVEQGLSEAQRLRDLIAAQLEKERGRLRAAKNKIVELQSRAAEYDRLSAGGREDKAKAEALFASGQVREWREKLERIERGV